MSAPGNDEPALAQWDKLFHFAFKKTPLDPFNRRGKRPSPLPLSRGERGLLPSPPGRGIEGEGRNVTRVHDSLSAHICCCFDRELEFDQ